MGVQGEEACHSASVGRTTKAIICGNHFTSEQEKENRKQTRDNRQQAAATARMVSFLGDTREGLACAEICQIKNGMPCGRRGKEGK